MRDRNPWTCRRPSGRRCDHNSKSYLDGHPFPSPKYPTDQAYYRSDIARAQRLR